MQNKNHHMKKAAIETIFVWIVIFTIFVSIFFFVIQYTTIVRVKDTMDSIANYASNYIATNGVGDDLSSRINGIATRKFNTISADTSAICSTTSNNEYKIIFNVTTTNSNLHFYQGQLLSKKVVFNQDGTGDTITCDLSVTIKN